MATRRVFELDGWFAFTDGTVDGQPAVIAKLTAEGEKHYPGFGNSFAGIFIGDPANLTQIRFTVLRTEPRAPEMYSDSCMLIERVLVIDVLPFTYEEKSTFTDWMQEKCRTVPLGNAEQTMIKKMQFVFERSKTNYINLIVTPQR